MTPSSPSQNSFARLYYEKAWLKRLDFMKELVDQGEKNPYRIIKALERRERHYVLNPNLDTGECQWNPIQFEDCSQLLPSGFPVIQKWSLLGQVIDLPYYTASKIHDLLIDIIYRNDFDCIVELGCGYGRNLFEIYYNSGPRDIPYIGGELTNSGIEALNLLSSLNEDINIQAFKFDFLEPDLSFLDGFKRIFFFTCHAIEQVFRVPDELFKVMVLCSDDVKCVHLEPFSFQLDPPLGNTTEVQKKFILQREWNINLMELLTKAEKEGYLRIEAIGREIFCNTDNPTSMAVWKGGRRA